MGQWSYLLEPGCTYDWDKLHPRRSTQHLLGYCCVTNKLGFCAMWSLFDAILYRFNVATTVTCMFHHENQVWSQKHLDVMPDVM